MKNNMFKYWQLRYKIEIWIFVCTVSAGFQVRSTLIILWWIFFDLGSQSAYTELSSHHYRNEEGFNEDVYNSEEEEDDLNLHLSDGNERDGNTDDEDNIPINFRNALILNEV